MRIWIEIHPLAWHLWPLRPNRDLDFRTHFAVGPISVCWS